MTDFEKTIAKVRECFRLVARTDLCLSGCKRMVHEGCRSYTEIIPAVHGVCPKCHKKRYTGKL